MNSARETVKFGNLQFIINCCCYVAGRLSINQFGSEKGHICWTLFSKAVFPKTWFLIIDILSKVISKDIFFFTYFLQSLWYTIDQLQILIFQFFSPNRCEFVNDEQTYRGQLADIVVSTEDLIIPLPIEIVTPANREEDFQTLWKWLAEDSLQEG